MPSRSRRLRSSALSREARLSPVDQLDLSDALVEALVRRVNEEAERQDRRAAEDFFDQGALLNEIALLTLDEESAAARFVDGADAARERMRLARATTRLLAGVYGLERCRLGLGLLERFELESFDQLEAVDLPVERAGGRAVRFPATRELLARALERLRSSAPAEGGVRGGTRAS